MEGPAEVSVARQRAAAGAFSVGPGCTIPQITQQEAQGMLTSITRRALPGLVGLAFLALSATSAAAETKWPAAMTYSLGLSSDPTAKIQTSAFFYGPLNEEFGAKIGGWWIAGGRDNRAFVGDAYVDYHKQALYLAAGRKFVPFGPAGILVSPGVAGGELRLDFPRVNVQAITGTLAFTPVTGGTRFTFAGNRSPADENITAGRVAVALAEPTASVPVTVGGNVLRLLDHTGHSGDISVDATKWLNLFGDAANFEHVHASAYGVRLSNQKVKQDPNRYTMLTIYHRRVPVGFLPAVVGATQYFEDQTGWVAGLYHQFNPRQGVGVYADNENAILTLFGYVPL
jgi:hypothetical protein